MCHRFFGIFLFRIINHNKWWPTQKIKVENCISVHSYIYSKRKIASFYYVFVCQVDGTQSFVQSRPQFSSIILLSNKLKLVALDSYFYVDFFSNRFFVCYGNMKCVGISNCYYSVLFFRISFWNIVEYSFKEKRYSFIALISGIILRSPNCY